MFPLLFDFTGLDRLVRLAVVGVAVQRVSRAAATVSVEGNIGPSVIGVAINDDAQSQEPTLPGLPVSAAIVIEISDRIERLCADDLVRGKLKRVGAAADAAIPGRGRGVVSALRRSDLRTVFPFAFDLGLRFGTIGLHLEVVARVEARRRRRQVLQVEVNRVVGKIHRAGINDVVTLALTGQHRRGRHRARAHTVQNNTLSEIAAILVHRPI